MKARSWRIILVPALTLLLGVAFLTLLPAGASRAEASADIVRVATTGADALGCGSAGSPCQTIQYAVHKAAEGDEIRIAAGTYTGAQQVYTLGDGQMTTMTQVVIVTKSLTLRGGFTTGDWDTFDPEANESIIDAEGYGRPLTIVGDGTQTVAVEGLTIRGGDYTGLGNTFADDQCLTKNGDCGGGIYAYDAVIRVRQSVITDNVASQTSSSSYGGGIFLFMAPPGSLVEDTIFANNRSFGTNSSGGGMAVQYGGAFTVSRSTFFANRAGDTGGGLISTPDGDALFVLEASEFVSNSVLRTANGEGGAVDIDRGHALVRTSTFISNTARNGGALTAEPSGDREIIVDANTFQHNWASQGGGAMFIGYGSVATVTNNIIVLNETEGRGDGALCEGVFCNFSHNTFAGEQSRTDGDAVYVRTTDTIAKLWNNIIVSYTNGVRTNSGVTVTVDHTLFYGNEKDIYAAEGTLTSTNQITGQPPLFADPSTSDYHLTPGSPAIDAGIGAGVKRDMDGDPRPIGDGYDIGADEVWTVDLMEKVYLPFVIR